MVFDNDFFHKHQRILLRFSNTILGRYVLRLHGHRSEVGKNKITRILPHAIEWDNADGTKTIEIRTHEKFAKRLYYAFKPVWMLIHLWDTIFANNYVPQYNLGFDTLDIFPDAGTGATTVDGAVIRTTTQETFSAIRSGAGTSVDLTDTSENVVHLQSDTNTDRYLQMRRGIFTFDTSPLTPYDIITSIDFSVRGTSKSNGLGSPDLHVAGATPASNNTLVAADYSQVQTTTFGNVTYAGFSTAGYNAITLNAAGLASINYEGVTAFSMQSSWDINNSFTGAWVNPGTTQFTVNMADASGTSTDPKLTVTYTPATVPTVTTTAVSGTGKNSATFGGNVTAGGNGNVSVIRRGVIVSTVNNPQGPAYTTSGTTGVYSFLVEGLKPGTTYFYRAFAENQLGIGYGSTSSFTTTAGTVPVVAHVTKLGVSTEGAVLTAYVSDNGGTAVFEQGVVVSTTPYPTTSNFKFFADDLETVFTTKVSGLATGTKYYARAYARNETGIGYSPIDFVFTTL